MKQGSLRESITGAGLVLPPEAPGAARALGPVFAHYLASSYESFCGLVSAHEGLFAPALRREHARVVAALRARAARDVRGALNVFASPGVGTPVNTARLDAAIPAHRARIERGTLAVTPHVLLELALRGLLDEGGRYAWAPTVLASPSIGGVLEAPEGTARIEFEGRGLRALGADGTVRGRVDLASREPPDDASGFRFTAAYHAIAGVTRLAVFDHNPLADFEAHPDKHGNPVDLGGHAVDAWVRPLEQALGIVRAHLPALFDEMKLLLREIIPVGFDEQKHLSASYREAIGTMYLTLHPREMTLAEAVVHEFQHSKLNAASYATEFIENAFSPLYPSPVRPDPRPLWGILLAVHAFLPVAVLYRQMRDAGHPLSQRADFVARLGDIDLRNHEGMTMLHAHAKLTPAGVAMMNELTALDRAHMAERAREGKELAPRDVHLA